MSKGKSVYDIKMCVLEQVRLVAVSAAQYLDGYKNYYIAIVHNVYA